MRSGIFQADLNGAIVKAGGRGIGFRLVPGVDTDAGPDVAAGQFPVRVQLRKKGGGNVGEPMTLVNSDALWVAAEGDEFASFDVLGCEPGDSWCVQTIERKSDGVLGSSAKTKRTRRVQPPLELPTDAPSSDVEEPQGLAVRPGTLSHDFYFSGDTGDGSANVEIWQESAGGTWVDTGQSIDQASEFVAHRAALIGAGRIYLRAPAAGLLCEIDVTEEVG